MLCDDRMPPVGFFGAGAGVSRRPPKFLGAAYDEFANQSQGSALLCGRTPFRLVTFEKASRQRVTPELARVGDVPEQMTRGNVEGCGWVYERHTDYLILRIRVARRPARPRRGLDQTVTIRVPSAWMANTEPRLSRGGDSEKITINLGYVDLGQIDLIVSDGFYANRTDFIRTAIRNQLDKHKETLAKSVERKSFDVGLHDYSREFLEKLQRSGQTVNVRVIGLVRIANDVSAELARATIASISVLGALQASAAVKAILSDRLS